MLKGRVRNLERIVAPKDDLPFDAIVFEVYETREEVEKHSPKERIVFRLRPISESNEA